MKTPLLAVCALLCALCAAAESNPHAAASPVFGGGLALPGVTFLPHAFDTMWRGFGPVTVQDGAEATDPSVAKVHFRMALGAGDPPPAFDGTATFSVAPAVQTAGPAGSLRAGWRLVATADADLNETYVGGDVPFSRFGGGKVILDGRDFPIPAEVTKQKHLFRGTVTNLALIDRDGAERLRIALDAPTRILLQDDRHWKTDDLSIRFYLAYGPVKAGAEYALGATFATPADGPLAIVPARTVRLVAGPDWIPLAREPWIEPGSALDFAGVIPHHEPAGKFGRVVAVGDHFEFEGLPGVPQRFYGVNLCGTANLPESREEADRFAANLARLGYNAVRIHHHEKWLVRKDGKLPEEAAPSRPVGADLQSAPFDGTVLDPAQMEKLDRLIASCIAHGLYITTDLYVSRGHVISWRSLGIDRDGPVAQDALKLLFAFYEPAYSNLCAWSKAFLGHVNPYTGRSLAEEPALCTLALVNEGNLGNFGTAILRDTPGVEEAWQEWQRDFTSGGGAARRLPRGEAAPLPTDIADPALATFLAERETMLFERLKAFVRDECGCAAPLSSISAWYNPVQYQLTRTHFDYVDNHFYVDHPSFLGAQWRLPSRCPNVNPFIGTAKGAQKAEWYRLMDKPFCVTEFNYSGPGSFRGVGGVALGALAALQDWSGLWRFAWSHSRGGIVNPGGQMGYFDLANDPLSLAAERAGLCLFLRRDLEPLAEERPALFDEAALSNPGKGAVDFPGPDQPLALGWEARVGTRVVCAGTVPGAQDSYRRQGASAPGAPAASKSAVLPAPSGNVAISPSGAFLIDTPRTCGGFAGSGAHQAGALRFTLSGTAAATVWVSSLDGEPIATSRHLLLSHLTDVQNSGIEYADQEHKILLNWGRLPHLMRNGAAEIELSLAQDVRDGTSRTSTTRVYRLSPSGRRLGEVPAAYDPATGILHFTARTDYDPAAASYLYEISR